MLVWRFTLDWPAYAIHRQRNESASSTNSRISCNLPTGSIAFQEPSHALLIVLELADSNIYKIQLIYVCIYIYIYLCGSTTSDVRAKQNRSAAAGDNRQQRDVCIQVETDEQASDSRLPARQVSGTVGSCRRRRRRRELEQCHCKVSSRGAELFV